MNSLLRPTGCYSDRGPFRRRPVIANGTQVLIAAFTDRASALPGEGHHVRLLDMSDTPFSTQPLQSGNRPSSYNIRAVPNVREIHIDFLLEEEFKVNPL